ncbi:hypothetical protein J3R83DRAFT_13991 [Lanmaoa asiatica]|nr:hypothetical protein J3R83DRAFT_13991 [Lanmaoa asiatica]
MHSPATTDATTPVTTPAKPRCQDEQSDIPGHLPTELVRRYLVSKWPEGDERHAQRVSTHDFHLDTHFNPVWMSGPHVFSFVKDGTVVRPERYSLEPYPGYYAYGPRRPESVNASYFQGFSPQDEKQWKNVAITEQDDAEIAAIEEREGENAGGEQRRGPYGQARCSMPDDDEPELVYTWPPMPHGQ